MTLIYLTIWYGLVVGQSTTGASYPVQFQKFGPRPADSCLQAADAINKALNFHASCAGGTVIYTMPTPYKERER